MNRRTINVLLIVFVCLVGASVARGWIAMTSPHTTSDHKVQLELTVDADKAKEDVKQAGRAVKEMSRDLINKIENKNEQPADHHPTQDVKN